MTPLEGLESAVYLLDRGHEQAFKVKAFVKAADVVRELGDEQIAELARAGRIQELEGIGKATGSIIEQCVAGETPDYLVELEEKTRVPITVEGTELRVRLKGDLHMHSVWSDGGATIRTMAKTAELLGHEYIVMTDHSPRLTVARGLTRERLEQQLDEIAELNEELAPFRILTGIEVDIFEDGSLDQAEDLLARLDLVVASVHSKFKMPSDEMTRRMVAAISSPYTDVLGHCTNRMRPREGSRRNGRGPSAFDADVVFAACQQFDVAVEINCRPERMDPPRELLKLVVEWGCKVTIDTDAHAPGQLEWQAFGCDRAVECGVDPDSIVNSWPLDELLAWTRSHRQLVA